MPETKKKSKFVIPIVIFGLLLMGFFIHTGYVLVKPGTAQDLRDMVTIEGVEQKEKGKFFLVTVAQKQADLWSLLYGYFHPHVELQHRSEMIPPGMQEQEYHQYLEQLMEESKNTARVIALRRAGYDVDIISKGVAVVGFLEQSPSEGVLQKGDLVTAVDGNKVLLAGEVISAVQQREIGDSAILTVRRDSQILDLTVTTTAHPEDPRLPALGIYISTLDWEPVLPLEIKLETGDIAGPSAGLMFVLEILNQLQPGDLTGGQLIAGTGTMDIDENINPIGGVFQKVIAAERAGADYFFVPQENYEEAKKAVHQITLLPVKTLQETLDCLSSLPSTGKVGFQTDHHDRGLYRAA